MIFDSLNHSGRYRPLHPGFETGFKFLKNQSDAFVHKIVLKLAADWR
jgi:hypothetical protein